MAKCTVCELIESKENMLFEDEKTVAVLAPEPAAAGHILLIPRQHAPILEQVPDFVIGDLFAKANKLGIAAFEAINAEGTNIMIQNGVAAGQSHNHFLINIIPRRQNDGLSFQWQPRQLDEEEMSTVTLKIKEEAKAIGEFEKEKQQPIEMKSPEERKPSGREVDYMLKQLKRLP